MARRMTMRERERIQHQARKKARKRKYRIRRLFVLFLFSVIIFGGFKLFSQTDEELPNNRVVEQNQKTTQNKAVQTEITDTPNLKARDKEQLINNLKIASKDYKNAEIILDNIDKVPDNLLKLAGRNFSAIDFVAKTLDDTVKVNYVYPKNLNGGKVPYFIQWDKKWGYAKYGEGIIGDTGCGPTSAAMVVSGLTDQIVTPQDIAQLSEKEGYVSNFGTSWDLYPFIAKKFDLKVEQMSPDYNRIKSNLEAGNLIIVSVSPGDFTEVGHVMVIVGMNSDNEIAINDPNNRENSEKRWTYDKLRPQIKTMWVFSKNGKIL